jgi:two-component system sensor histidine kinase CpxA
MSRPRLNLWLVLAIFLSLGVLIAAGFMMFDFGRRTDLIETMSPSVCEIAASSWERGGIDGLSSTTQTFARLGTRPYLFDTNGKNLAGGESRSVLFPPTRRLPPNARLVETGGRYSCAVVSDFSKDAFNPPPNVWVLPFLSVLCCLFAWYVTLRMRRIEAVVTNFGSGNLGARVSADSGDPIGRLSRSFNQMADRIESLVGAHQRLCIDISHELRSPLARLRLAVGLARSGTHGALDRIEAESDRLNDLVNELLEVARAEVDPGALSAEKVDLGWMVEEVVEACLIEAEDRGCHLDFKPESTVIVRGDRELLRRAVENVLRNAIRHSPEGERIELIAAADEKVAWISIRDHGPGVPEAALGNIFEPFYRVGTDRDRKSGGAGMGLAIVERAIAVHEGSVTAHNCNPGLRIEIRIPLIPGTPN